MGEWISKNIPGLIALVCVVAVMGILCFIAVGTNEKLTFAVISILSMTMSNIVGFYFGSSAGSTEKSRVIEGQLKNLTRCNGNGENVNQK